MYQKVHICMNQLFSMPLFYSIAFIVNLLKYIPSISQIKVNNFFKSMIKYFCKSYCYKSKRWSIKYNSSFKYFDFGLFCYLKLFLLQSTSRDVILRYHLICTYRKTILTYSNAFLFVQQQLILIWLGSFKVVFFWRVSN